MENCFWLVVIGLACCCCTIPLCVCVAGRGLRRGWVMIMMMTMALKHCCYNKPSFEALQGHAGRLALRMDHQRSSTHKSSPPLDPPAAHCSQPSRPGRERQILPSLPVIRRCQQLDLMWRRIRPRIPRNAQHREGGVRREEIFLLARDVRPLD
jgi:hypothetical protein